MQLNLSVRISLSYGTSTSSYAVDGTLNSNNYLSSVQFKVVSMRSEKPIYALLRLS